MNSSVELSTTDILYSYIVNNCIAIAYNAVLQYIIYTSKTCLGACIMRLKCATTDDHLLLLYTDVPRPSVWLTHLCSCARDNYNCALRADARAIKKRACCYMLSSLSSLEWQVSGERRSCWSLCSLCQLSQEQEEVSNIELRVCTLNGEIISYTAV